MKKIEINKLKTIDVEENLTFQRKKKQQMQDYWYKTEYLKHAFNVEAEHQVTTLIEDTKNKTWRKELEASQINPRMEVSFMKPEQLFQEVRNKKLLELKANHHNKPPTKESKEIIGLLQDMKGGKAKKVGQEDDKLVNANLY